MVVLVLPLYWYYFIGISATYLFFTLNFHRLEAEVIAGNDRAVSLVKKAGFVEEGRLREAKFIDGIYHDILRFGLLRPEYKPQ